MRGSQQVSRIWHQQNKEIQVENYRLCEFSSSIACHLGIGVEINCWEKKRVAMIGQEKQMRMLVRNGVEARDLRKSYWLRKVQ